MNRLAAPQRLSQGTLDRPFMAGQSQRQDRGWQADGVRPLTQRACLAVEHDDSVHTGVIALLPRRCPPTIFRRIWAIVVDTVERVPFRTRSHVAKKGTKVAAPRFNHHDSAPAVGLVFRALWVATSVFRALPTAVLACLYAAVRRELLSCAISIPASTALGRTGFQFLLGNLRDASTQTAAFPKRVVVAPTDALNNCEATKCLAA